MSENLLPIGTVVKLVDSTTKVMIMGYCPLGSVRPGYVWDYSGVVYPYGYMDASKIIQFDKEQIEKVMAIGYQDVETFDFMEKLVPAAEQLKQKNSDGNAPKEREDSENV